MRGINHSLRATYIDDTFDMNEMGFLTRNDQANLDYTFFKVDSNLASFRQRTTNLSIVNQFNTQGQPVQNGMFFGRNYQFNNFDSVNYRVGYFPPRTDDRLGRGTGDFKIPERYSLSAGYESNKAEATAWNVGIDLSQEDLGASDISGSAGLRGDLMIGFQWTCSSGTKTVKLCLCIVGQANIQALSLISGRRGSI